MVFKSVLSADNGRLCTAKRGSRMRSDRMIQNRFSFAAFFAKKNAFIPKKYENARSIRFFSKAKK